jgi:hypothetical protein
MRVYVAGPYTAGNVVVNVRNAVLAADQLFEAGHTPYVPHLNHLWHTIAPRPWADWLRMDLEWLAVCDALLRLPGESQGADAEVERAKSLRIPVFYEIATLLRQIPA